MSAWHREHPELIGTDRDPWMMHEGYRKALPRVLTDDEPLDLAPSACMVCGFDAEGEVDCPRCGERL